MRCGHSTTRRCSDRFILVICSICWEVVKRQLLTGEREKHKSPSPGILSAGQIPDIPGRQLQLTWQGNFQIAVSSRLNASETTPPRWGSHTRLLLSFNLNTRQKLCFLSERRHNVIIPPACYAHVATGHNDKVNLFFVHVVTGDLSVQLVEVSLLSPLDDTLLTPAP